MKLNISALINSKEVFHILGNAQGLSAHIAYRLYRNIELINKELEMYEKTRIKLLKSLANKDENGEPIIKKNNNQEFYDLSDENLQKFNEDIFKMVNESVELDLKKISLDDIDSVGLTPFQISLIDFILDV